MTRIALSSRFSAVRSRMAAAAHAAVGSRLAKGDRARPRYPVESLEGRTFLSITGAVFAATNHNNTQDANEPANQVVMYNRDETGKLTIAGTYDTGGQGSGPSVRFAGDGLGSAHSVQLSRDKKFLFVANAGSDSVSVFRVSPDGLELTDVQPTGDFPNSIAQAGNKVYVLQNAGGPGAITGYTLNSSTGQLTPLAGSTRTLNANQDSTRPDTLFNPAQVSFTPSGKQLVVTIKDGPAAGAIPGVTPTGPGRVLVFNVNDSGLPSSTFKQTNLNNRGPFGFSFDKNGKLLTSLFVGGPGLTAAAGSFKINANGSLTAITAVVPDTQLDSCWIENNGKYAWTANYTSGTISTYRIGDNGSLTLTQAVAASAFDQPGGGGKVQGATPLDLRVSPNGQYLYNVLPGSGALAAFRVLGTGGLVKLGEFGGLPDTVNGDSAPNEFGPGGSPAGVDVLDYATPIEVARNVAYVQSNNPVSGKNAILAYRRDPTTGNLTPLAGGGVFLTGGTGYLNVDDRIGPDDSDQEVVVSKDRKFLFTVNQGSNTVTTFRIAADGSLTRIGVVDSNGKQPVSVGIVNKSTLIVVNKGDQNPGGSGGTSKPNYTSFRVAADGTLSKVVNSRVEVGAGASPTQALVSRDGKFVFGDNFLAREFDPPAGFPSDLVPPFGSELESFKLDANLKLQRNAPAQPSQLPGVADKFILNMQAHPTHNVVYAGFVVGNKLGVYKYNAAGVLQFVKAVGTAGQGLCWIVISPDGKRLYGTNFSSDSVSVFDISDPLNPVEIQDVPLKLRNPHPSDQPSPAQFDTVAFQLSIDPEGKHVYVVNHEQTSDNRSTTGNAVHVLTVGANGTLTENAASPVVLTPPLVPFNAHPMGVVAI
jgi:6-phosphogluconolactonase